MQIELNPEQFTRYSQQLKLAGMTPASQHKLLKARVLVLGMNSTGAVATHFLAAAGVGNIGLMDGGTVDASDLGNLLLYSPVDLGTSRVEIAHKKMLAVNSDVRTIMHSQHFDAHNAEGILPQYEVVVDGLSNWQDKLLASDICMRMRMPLIHAGCLGFRLQIYSMLPGKSACLRCIFSQIGMEDLIHLSANQECFGPTLGLAGAFQATAVIKLIANLGIVPSDQLIQFDALRNELSAILDLSARSDCPDCGRTFKRRS